MKELDTSIAFMRNFVKALFFLLLINCFQLFGQKAISLEEAISIALENNFQLKINSANIKVAEINNSWARAGRNPTVDVNGTFGSNLIRDNNPVSFINGSYYTGSLGLSLDAQWLVYNGGRVGIVKDQLDLSVKQEELLRSSQVNDLIRNVIQSYSLVQWQESQIKALNEQMSLSQDRLEYEEVKKEFGQSNSQNLTQFQQSVLSDSILIMNQKNNAEIALLSLLNVLDVSEDQKFSVIGALSFSDEEMDREKLRELIIESNPNLRQIELGTQLAILNSELEKSNGKPRVSIGGSLGGSEGYFKSFANNPITGEVPAGNFSNRLNMGLTAQASWNIFDGGVRKDNRQANKIREEIAELDILDLKANLLNQLDALLENYKNQQQLLILNEEQIKLAKLNMDLIEERFKAAQVTSLDFRNVQNQLLNAEISKLNSIYNLLITKSDIDWLIGNFK